MEYYIKYISSLTYTPIYKLDDVTCRLPKTLPTVRKGEKYREWDFFGLIFFIFFRTKIAKEDLWVCWYDVVPNAYDFLTLSKLEKYYHYFIPNNDGVLYAMAKVSLVFSDGTQETRYFKTNEEAEEFRDECREKYELKLYKKL